MTAPSVPDDVLHRCHYLRTVGRLPVFVDAGHRLTLTVGGSLNALTTGEYWGYRLAERLREFGIGVPALWHPFRKLTFLTGPFDPDECSESAMAVLRETESTLLTPGECIRLPGRDDAMRGWIEPVGERIRPPAAVVLDALAACVAREAR